MKPTPCAPPGPAVIIIPPGGGGGGAGASLCADCKRNQPQHQQPEQQSCRNDAKTCNFSQIHSFALNSISLPRSIPNSRSVDDTHRAYHSVVTHNHVGHQGLSIAVGCRSRRGQFHPHNLGVTAHSSADRRTSERHTPGLRCSESPRQKLTARPCCFGRPDAPLDYVLPMSQAAPASLPELPDGRRFPQPASAVPVAAGADWLCTGPVAERCSSKRTPRNTPTRIAAATAT